MDKHKLKIAQSDGVTLLCAEASPSEAIAIIQKVELRIGAKIFEVANAIIRGSTPLSWLQMAINATDINLKNVEIAASEGSCLIIWDKSSVDSVSLKNLVECFDYYWYESCDDIFVVHVEKDEIYFIRHDGIIYKYGS